ncbi:hypothetical protein [Mycolicibacter kumamotonensis]|uniref:hypothetical protein n=1 Tax=Mycolicibacter kumamotonensis TaxID=354243 RepID=UPI000A6CADB1|nr:hypothetical protein [Mycolicibacter kumamotonensis]
MGNGFVIGVVACIAAQIVVGFLTIPLPPKRQIYWSLAVLSAVLAFLAAYPKIKLGLGVAAFMLGVMVWSAFYYTPYIRTRGKIYAFTSSDTNADVDGARVWPGVNRRRLGLEDWLATARGLWWFIAGLWLVFDASITGSLLHGHALLNDGHDRIVFASIFILLGLFGVALGFIESVNEYPLAQRQTVQFVIATISSAGLFAAFYLMSYYLTALTRGRSSDE